MTIAVTGGNGEFGRAVLESLSHLPESVQAGESFVATVRDLAKVQPLPGVDYRPGGFDEPDTLRGSLAAIEVLLINATFFGADPATRLPRVTAAIRAATEAGVGRIVLTSWPDLEHATLPDIQDYKRLESLVQTAGPAWTILRVGHGLADAIARDVVWGKTSGELVAPAAGARVTPAAVTDLAEAAAVVLAAPGHEGVVYELTGPDQVTWNDLAGLAGTPFRAATDDEYRDYLTQFSLPSATVQQLIGLYAEFRSGWNSTPTPTLAHLIGHDPLPGLAAVSRRVARFPHA